MTARTKRYLGRKKLLRWVQILIDRMRIANDRTQYLVKVSQPKYQECRLPKGGPAMVWEDGREFVSAFIKEGENIICQVIPNDALFSIQTGVS